MTAGMLGVLAVSILLGVWWLTLIAGVVALLFERSYIVLVVGVFLDLWFVTHGASPLFYGFYTLTFTLTTFLTEYIRRDLFWTS